MQNAPLFHVLLDHLESINAPLLEVQRYIERWHRLRPHESFPCPVCFLMGDEQPPIPLNVRGSLEPVVCPTCRTRFNVPIDDE
ncbi:conserved hypothetical protein [Paraburkholderia caribensis]|nr:conserved hypothetical protein [Paraburkholderia caribensis]